MASILVEAGMRVVQCLGVPKSFDLAAGADAVVIALRTRTAPREEAIEQSLLALESLQAMGARRFYFKYSSTFESTEGGNIGPAAEALLKALNVSHTIFCPSLPEYGRTVYQGHLFVGDKLLGESGMENHPLTPMRDANLVRVLSKQTQLNVRSIPIGVVQLGDRSLKEKLILLEAMDGQFIIVDALSDQHLQTIALACADMRLVTGSSGLAGVLPDVYRAIGLLSKERSIPRMPKLVGQTAILSGSCSKMTQEQVAFMQSHCPCYSLDVRQCISHPDQAIGDAIDWVKHQSVELPILIYSTAPANEVAAHQSEFGREIPANSVQSSFAAIAVRLVNECGVRRMVIAGGETSGAIVSCLGVKTLRIGPKIATGVPWMESIGERQLAFALKAGNFGTPDFYQRAVAMLE